MQTPRLAHLRLILMSATASSDLFVRYFTSTTNGGRSANTVTNTATTAASTGNNSNKDARKNNTTKHIPVVLEIPGRTFPVDVKWLSDCERITGTTMSCQNTNDGNNNNSNNNTSTTSGVDDNNDVAGGNGRVLLSPRAVDKIDNNFIRSLIAKIVQQQLQERSASSVSTRTGKNRKQDNQKETGAILVFLPGKGEIESLARCLYNDEATNVGDRSVCTILKLHSAVPKRDQDRVFKPALNGTIKIVLATNIAETSVTIPDITHVIDTCRVKESRYNASTRIREIVTVWTSRASMQQRSGRAGRTSSGIAWRLCTEKFCNDTIVDQTAPEMLRTPLDELILQICLLYEQRRDEYYWNIKKKNKEKESSSLLSITKRDNDDNNSAEKQGSNNVHGSKRLPSLSFATGAQPIKFLSMTPAPPPRNSLLQACRHLLEVDAIRVVDQQPENNSKNKNSDNTASSEKNNRNDEAVWSYRLTPLGYHLSRLPMDAKVGKVLIIGCILGCLDGALTVAAALSCTKSCFLSYHQNSDPCVISARESLIENGFGGKTWSGGTVKGDLIAVICAFRAWKQKKSDQQKWKFCNGHGLSHSVLQDMDQLRNQFTKFIIDAGFGGVTSSSSSNSNSTSSLTGSGGNQPQRQRQVELLEDCNHASDDALLTSCCLVGGLYPNICSLIRPRKGGPKGGRLYTNNGDECRPQSNSFQRKRVQQASESGKDAYGVYHSKHRSIGTSSTVGTGTHQRRPPEVFVTELNFVSRFALLLFGGELEIVKNALIVDGWLKFKVSGEKGGNNKNGASTSTNGTIDNAVLIVTLKERLDQIILDYIVIGSCSTANNQEEKVRLSERRTSIINVVRKLLSEES